MKRHLFSVFASLVLAGTLAGAQSSPSAPQGPAPEPGQPAMPPSQPAQPSPGRPGPQAPSPDEPAQPAQPAQPPAPAQSAQPADEGDTTLKGCLVQGSGPDVFILDNATPSTAASGAKGERYLLEISATPEQLKPVMNAHVEVSGTAEKAEAKADAAPAAASGQDEKSLPKLTAKRITRIAATCPAASGD
jgi:hypothetical protein